ncbi:MAG: glycosyltransferase [Chloroflexi bacterium]|nr:glycosyltransferase [Chloroflexota bacterium]
MNGRRSSQESPLRVGMLHYTCPPVVGGVERLMAIHARLLADQGHQVRVLAGRGGQARRGIPTTLLPELDSKHPSVLALNRALEQGEVSEGFEAQVGALERRLAAALEPLDVCLVHNAFTLHFNLPLTAALHRLAGYTPARLIAWCHDLAWANPLYLPQMRPCYPWVLLRTAAPGVQYVAVSEDRRADLARLAGLEPEAVRVIPAGIDPVRAWKLRPATWQLLAQLHLLEADPFILLPARITRRKNIELAIRTVAALAQDGLRPRLVVTGPPGPHNVRSGDYVSELRRERSALGLEREVVFLFETRTPGGQPVRVSDAMMDDLYLAADLLLFPSSQEGFGIPMLEAGVAGLPVFAANIPALRETAGPHARFFDLQDSPERIAAAISRFVRSDPVYRLRKKVLSEYTWERIYRSQIEPILRVQI